MFYAKTLRFLLGTGRMPQGQRSSRLDTPLFLRMLEQLSKFLVPEFRILVPGLRKLRSLLSATYFT